MCTGGLLALFLALGAARSEIVLDSRRIDYLEGEGDERAVAEVRAVLVRDGEEVRLRITASALGPFVDPPAGFEGVRGANPITAREMEALLEERAIRASSIVDGGSRAVPFRFREGTRASLPERRRLPDRSVSPPRPGREIRLVEIVAESGPLEEGLHETEMLVRGAPRLQLRYRVTDEGGRILDLRGGHPRIAP